MSVKKLLTIIFMVPLLLFGAITSVDKSSGGAAASNPTSAPVTNNAAANTLAIVMVHASHSTLTNRSATKVIFGNTGNTNMTRFARVDDASTKQNTFWYILSPSSGSNLVSATFGGTPTVASLAIKTYAGAAQSGQPDSFSQDVRATATVHVFTNTTTAADCLVVQSLLKTLVTGTVTDGSNQTVDFDASVGATYWSHGSYQILTGGQTGAIVFTNTFSLTSPSINCMGAFSPAAAAAGSTNYGYPFTDLRLMGVGQ